MTAIEIVVTIACTIAIISFAIATVLEVIWVKHKIDKDKREELKEKEEKK